MFYEEILEKLKNNEIVSIKNTWCFYGTSMACGDGCCDTTFDSIEEAAEMAAYYNK